MFANKFFLLFINFLWMAGLFGALFALLYLAQYRRRHWWSTGVYQVPRTLAPLYGALVLFLSGLALHAYAVGQPATLVVAAIWTLLALFFLYHAIELVIDGVQEGWDSALVEPQVGSTMGAGFSVGAIVVTLLLMVNVGMLSWWGAGQVRAGTLDLQALTKPFANRAVVPSGEVRPPAAATPGNQPATGLGAWMTNVTTVVGEQITAISQGFLTTPATPPATPTLTRVLTPFAGGQAALDAQRAITPTATLSATATVTATVTPTVTPTVTATVTPTVTPTATPTVTPTVTPPPTSSPTPRPTATATVTATPRPSPTPTVVAGVVTPLNPLTGESSNGVVRFEWSANFTPSEGYAFELVFWRPQQEPLKQGFGVAAPTRGYEAKVDLRELDNRLGDRLEPGTYQWGLLLVRTQPTYTRIRYVGGDWLVTYNR